MSDTPSAAYLDFIATANPHPIILVEVEPKQRLEGVWEAAGVNSFSTSWPQAVESSVYPGGLYREITGMWNDTTELVERASKVDVAANGGWYYDVPTETLFVRTNPTTLPGDNESPDDFDIVYVTFRIYLASEGVVLNNQFYEPLIDANSEIRIEESTDNLLLGDLKSVGSATFSLMNGTGVFDRLSSSWQWNGAPVTIRFGGPGLTYGDFATIGSYEVDRFAFGLDTVAMQVRDAQQFTHQPLVQNSYSSQVLTNMDPNENGTLIPVLIGSQTNITPVLVDSTDQKGQYMIADNALQSLYAVDSVYVDGVALSGADYNVSLTGCTFTILSTYAGGTPSVINAAVTCDAIGQPVQSRAYETSTDYLKYYGEIVSWIYSDILGLGVAAIDSAAATTADASETIDQSFYFQNEIHCHTAIRSFERGVLGRTTIQNGLVTPTVFEPVTSSQIDDDKVLTDPGVSDFAPLVDDKLIFSDVEVLHCQDPTTGTFEVQTDSSFVTRDFRLGGKDRLRRLTTYLTTVINANNLASRLILVFQDAPHDLELFETGISLIHLSPQDRISLTLARAPAVEGSYSDYAVEVRSIVKTLAPTPQVSFVVSDFNHLSGVGLWSDDSQPDYDDATEAERRVSGYFTDVSGGFDTSPTGGPIPDPPTPARFESVYY